jgi:hypothetical protein
MKLAKFFTGRRENFAERAARAELLNKTERTGFANDTVGGNSD